ncbi:hypothetical protein EPO33_02620 [Patescibacteria group bacterium]|nr:MAG: hypothetical protein EPO33_02620 [Patescibacteria group bacterium]
MQPAEPRQPEDAHFAPIAEIFGLRGGVNSEIRYVRSPLGTLTVEARYGAKKGGFPHAEAVRWSDDIAAYHDELARRGVPLPPLERMVIEHDRATERAVIVKTSPWTGHDVSHLLEHTPVGGDPDAVARLVRQICAILVPICAERHVGWETEVGIDPRCSNFTVDADARMWFVDLFPPRFRKNGIPIVEWPHPQSDEGFRLGVFKHFDVRGIALTTIAQLSRILPLQKAAFENDVIAGLAAALRPEERTELADGLARSPWHRVRTALAAGNTAEVAAIIAGAPTEPVFGAPYGVYALREIALELAAAGRLTRQALEDFFRASHYEDALPKERLEGLIRQLQAAT